MPLPNALPKPMPRRPLLVRTNILFLLTETPISRNLPRLLSSLYLIFEQFSFIISLNFLTLAAEAAATKKAAAEKAAAEKKAAAEEAAAKKAAEAEAKKAAAGTFFFAYKKNIFHVLFSNIATHMNA